MPKLIELTVEIDIQSVSCPGVWLCQDGRVSLTVYALGTSYQTCLLPPTFPLMFKDVFYFRKRFQETCALNNICCLLKDETIYCELVQWSQHCISGDCVILAQYLGSINEVLFPPNMCSNDGVDLLMRRSPVFPGILSPKIEIATKVRIDEVWNQNCIKVSKINKCFCISPDVDASRQKQVCHTARYHRNMCNNSSIRRLPGCPRTRSRSRSCSSRSCCSLFQDPDTACPCPPSTPKPPRSRSAKRSRCTEFNVFNMQTDGNEWTHATNALNNVYSDESNKRPEKTEYLDQKTTLESRYIDVKTEDEYERPGKSVILPNIRPCVCEICKRYHELFHIERS